MFRCSEKKKQAYKLQWKTLGKKCNQFIGSCVTMLHSQHQSATTPNKQYPIANTKGKHR